MNTIEELMNTLPKRSQKQLRELIAEAGEILEERAMVPQMINVYHLVYEWTERFQGRTYECWEWICSPSKEKLEAAVPESRKVTKCFTRKVKNSKYWAGEPIVARGGDRKWVIKKK